MKKGTMKNLLVILCTLGCIISICIGALKADKKAEAASPQTVVSVMETATEP